jgi:hypothetical protein
MAYKIASPIRKCARECSKNAFRGVARQEKVWYTP